MTPELSPKVGIRVDMHPSVWWAVCMQLVELLHAGDLAESLGGTEEETYRILSGFHLCRPMGVLQFLDD